MMSFDSSNFTIDGSTFFPSSAAGAANHAANAAAAANHGLSGMANAAAAAASGNTGGGDDLLNLMLSDEHAPWPSAYPGFGLNGMPPIPTSFDNTGAWVNSFGDFGGNDLYSMDPILGPHGPVGHKRRRQSSIIPFLYPKAFASAPPLPTTPSAAAAGASHLFSGITGADAKLKKMSPKNTAMKAKKLESKSSSAMSIVTENGEAKPKKKRSRVQSSKYRGVSRCSKDGRWQARIRVGQQVKYLGRFKEEMDAARCYDQAAIRLHGKRAMPNFPPSTYGIMTDAEGNPILPADDNAAVPTNPAVAAAMTKVENIAAAAAAAAAAANANTTAPTSSAPATTKTPPPPPATTISAATVAVSNTPSSQSTAAAASK